MENSRKSRKIVLIALILFVLLLLVFLFFFMSIFRNGLSRKDVQTILDRRNSLTSVHIKLDRRSIISDEYEENPIINNIEMFMYGDYAQVCNYLENGKRIITQENKATGEKYIISEDNETILAVSQLNIFNNVINYDVSNISTYKKFKYLGTTKIENRENIIIFLQRDNKSQKEFVYIDAETGLITKHVFECEDYHIVDSAKIEFLDNEEFVVDVQEISLKYKKLDAFQNEE